MDENQVEETETNSTVGAYVALFSTVAAVGFLSAAAAVAGAEVALLGVEKLKSIRTARAAKKAAQTED